MNGAPAWRLAVSNLSVGVSRIGIRHGHTRPRYKVPRPELAGHPPGHGEKIWIFNDLLSKEIVYSHTAVLDAHKALRQIPFSGKKSKPAKIRKDRWRRLAVIQFPEGRGIVGQSVFQKLREFRQRHLLEWEDDMFFRPREEGSTKLSTLSRQARGRALHAQKENSIADLAAVLAGAGRGNKMWVDAGHGKSLENASQAGHGAAESTEALCGATVFWANELDRNYAEQWTSNVKHKLLADYEPPSETESASLDAPAEEGGSDKKWFGTLLPSRS